MLIVAWVGCWLAHDICFTSAPTTYNFYINRRNDGDACGTLSNCLRPSTAVHAASRAPHAGRSRTPGNDPPKRRPARRRPEFATPAARPPSTPAFPLAALPNSLPLCLLLRPSAAKTAPAPCHTYLTFNTNASTDAIVHFHSTKLYANPRVYYGSTGSGIYSSFAIASSHKVDIDASRYIYYGYLRSLTPDTTYWFKVGDGSNTTSDTYAGEKKFRTAPISGDVSFVTGGDMGVTAEAKTLLQSAAQLEPLYIAVGGDLAYENGIRACYPRWDAWLSQWEQYAVTPTGYTIPIIASPGNHEAGGWEQPMKNMRFYNRYFVFEDLAGGQAWELPLHHVHYISNQVLVALDSYVVETPASQVSWLTNVLSSAAPGSLKMAMYHAPGYPSVRVFSNPESVGVRTHFVPVFDQYGLTVGLENHDHAFKRTKLLYGGVENSTGVLYVGDGAMGVKARTAVSITGRDYLEVLIAKQFYIHVQPNNTASAVKFDTYDIDSKVFDTYTTNYRN